MHVQVLGSNLSNEQVAVVSSAIQVLHDEFERNIPVDELRVCVLCVHVCV